MSTAMRLDELLVGYAETGEFADALVSGLSLDSRAIARGDAFVALQGTREHGIAFAPAALTHGATIVLAETAPNVSATSVTGNLLWVDGLREKLGAIAARFYAEPSRKLRISGVTGIDLAVGSSSSAFPRPPTVDVAVLVDWITEAVPSA